MNKESKEEKEERERREIAKDRILLYGSSAARFPESDLRATGNPLRQQRNLEEIHKINQIRVPNINELNRDQFDTLKQIKFNDT
mmetsp:Transcript_11545/g.19517  ORF Transcript_11545/g.19517 Transcript_11545/m.19517 type:complete len:84 (+) Transcript_11545:757-1008(+)